MDSPTLFCLRLVPLFVVHVGVVQDYPVPCCSSRLAVDLPPCGEELRTPCCAALLWSIVALFLLWLLVYLADLC